MCNVPDIKFCIISSYLDILCTKNLSLAGRDYTATMYDHSVYVV